MGNDRVALILLCSIYVSGYKAEMSLTTFTGEVACGLAARLASACAQLHSNSYKSLVHCATSCNLVRSCTGVSKSESGQCYHHQKCPGEIPCNQQDKLLIYHRVSQPISSLSTKILRVTTTDPEDLSADLGTGTSMSTTSFYTVGNSEVSGTSSETAMVATKSELEVDKTTTSPGSPKTVSTQFAPAVTTVRSLGSTTTTPNSIPNPCQNQGNWNSVNNTCTCTSGWVGQRCDRRTASCYDIAHNGPNSSANSVYWMEIKLDNSSAPFLVKCQFRGNKVLTYAMSNNGWGNHNRTLAEYTRGYHIDEDNFWLGLSNMRALTLAGYTTMCLGVTAAEYVAMYKYTVTIDDQYRFDYNSCSMSVVGSPLLSQVLSNCLETIKMTQFTTWDSNQWNSGCAASAGIGWWISTCGMPCNPLGVNYKKLPGSTTVRHMNMPTVDFQFVESNGLTPKIFIYFEK